MTSTTAQHSFLDELGWRGLLHQTTADSELRNHLKIPGQVAYCGFDPTGDSLTIGNLIPIMLLKHWQRAGHRPIVVMGGGTGLIGDPSGKDDERQLLTGKQVAANVEGQKVIFERILDFDDSRPNGAVIVNNLDWLVELKFIEVLREVGKYFSVNTMIQKDSVRERLHTREQGISYTEFSYMILQAYDFLHLRRTMNCTCQIAGSDQYGNIVAGIDLIRREFGVEGNAYGITAPLVTTTEGKKIGKTEKGAVWLTRERTSPYAFYQFWINADDADVISYLKWYTLFTREEIEELTAKHKSAPHERAVHQALAAHLTTMIHGEGELARVESASRALFSGEIRGLDAEMLDEVFADVPATTEDRGLLEGVGVDLVELLPRTSLASSKRQAREFLENGAVSVNGKRVGKGCRLKLDDLLHGKTILLRRGKKMWHATGWE